MIRAEVVSMKIKMNWFKEHILWVVLVVVLLLIISFGQFIVYQNNIASYETEMQTLTQERDRLLSETKVLTSEKERLISEVTSLVVEKKQETDLLKSEIESLNVKIRSAVIPFDFIMEQLKNKGFETSEKLLETLSEENDLIPYEGELGGTMRWWPTESRILNNHWALGYFEDGHVAGQALLEYQIDENQNVTWKLIKAILY
jgi:hypothetical protein